jgi:hypothetical protein
LTGWINIDMLGIYPFDKPWMAKLAGLKYDDTGNLVNDPGSRVRLNTITYYMNSYAYEFDSEHKAFVAVSKDMTFVKPLDYEAVLFIAKYGPEDAKPCANKVYIAKTFAPSDLPDMDLDTGSAATSPSTKSVFSHNGEKLDTPATQVSFDVNEVAAEHVTAKVAPLPAKPKAKANVGIVRAKLDGKPMVNKLAARNIPTPLEYQSMLMKAGNLRTSDDFTEDMDKFFDRSDAVDFLYKMGYSGQLVAWN